MQVSSLIIMRLDCQADQVDEWNLAALMNVFAKLEYDDVLCLKFVWTAMLMLTCQCDFGCMIMLFGIGFKAIMVNAYAMDS